MLDTLWSPRGLVATVLLGEALAAILVLGTPEPGWVDFGLTSLAAQWVLLLALAGVYAARRHLRESPTPILAAATTLALVGATLAVTFATSQLVPSIGEQLPGGWAGLAGRAAIIVAIVGLLAMLAIHKHFEARRFAVRAKQAELDVLQARIRPHFLFNTINTASALLHRDPALAEHVLLDLADLFRASLGKASSILIEEELDLTRRYLDIERLRFGDRLTVEWNVPDGLPAIRVPPLSIQPLVENAVRHGIERLVEGGVVRVDVRARNQLLEIEIENPLGDRDGSPLQQGHGVGLRASIARIEAATDGLGEVRAGATRASFITRVTLPIASCDLSVGCSPGVVPEDWRCESANLPGAPDEPA